MSDAAPWTIGRLLQWTQEFLTTRGADSPRLDAEILLAQARGCKRIELYTAFDDVPSDAVRGAFRELVRRRGEGTPVAYLVGHREFYSLELAVSPDVLIPRPETEFVVVAALDFAKAHPQRRPLDVVDLGTGSGAIAVAVAKRAAAARVLALDKSREALAVARTNVQRHQLADRVELLESDWWSQVPRERAFDLVLANPPYVTSAEMPTLAAEVARHEPRLALEAGPTGLEAFAQIVPTAVQRLKPGGQLILETSPALEPALRELLAAEPQLELGPTRRDLAGLPRVVVASRRALGG